MDETSLEGSTRWVINSNIRPGISPGVGPEGLIRG